MLKLEHVNLLIELCGVQGVSVPIKMARLAADAYDALLVLKTELETPKEETPV